MIKNDNFSPLSAIVTSVEQNFFVPFADSVFRERAKQGARKMLVDFVKKHEEDMKRIKEVETRIEFPVQRATITGKVDVIMHSEDSLEVRDYKTSDIVTTEQESAFQVQLYSLGLRMLKKPINKASIAYLESATTKQVEVEQPKLLLAKTNAEKHIENINNRQFNACPGDFCQSCDHAVICKWRRTTNA
jgi:DNA helicase-2/ATP-dependent DNA helicase PcrA